MDLSSSNWPKFEYPAEKSNQNKWPWDRKEEKVKKNEKEEKKEREEK